MGTSPDATGVGARFADRTGWRAAVATALVVVLARPYLWLLGALSFAMRGGFLLLALVIVVLPTPVEVRTLLGDNLASSGLTPAFVSLLVALAVGAGMLVAAALAIAARVETAAFEVFVRQPDADAPVPGPWGAEERTSQGAWLGLLARLFLVLVLAASVVALAAIPLAASLYDASMDELLRPTPGGQALYLRILGSVREPLLILVGGIVLADTLAAVVSRHLMARQHAGIGTTRPAARPLAMLATALVTWLLAAAVLLPVAWALDVAWDATRAAYLGAPAAIDLPAAIWLGVITLAFVAMWAAAVVVAGFVSALRAALWTAEVLR